MNYKAFSALIVITLLLLYAIVMGYVIHDLLTEDSIKYTSPAKQAVTIITTIGGLISALVIAKLTITQPGDVPSFISTKRSATSTPEKALTATYLIIWFIVGLGCLIIGTFFDDRESLINDIGTNWFGIAIAAAYAYFGLTPENE